MSEASVVPSPYPSKESTEDVALAYLKDFASPIPGLATVIERHILPPLVKRRTQWYQEVAEILKRHEEELSQLRADPIAHDKFLSLFIEASKGALATHETSKRERFRIALEHSILYPIDFDRQLFFLRMLEEFQELHVQVLQMFVDPTDVLSKVYSNDEPTKRPTRMVDIVLLGVPSVPREILTLAIRDLTNAMFVEPDVTQRVVSVGMELTGAATVLGKDFVHFLT